MLGGWKLNLPPGWPAPPPAWRPATGWRPDPAWPELPPGWQLWVPAQQEPPRWRRAVLTLTASAAIFAVVTFAAPRADRHPAADPDPGPSAVVAPAPTPTRRTTPAPTPMPASSPTPIRIRTRTTRATPRRTAGPRPLAPHAYPSCAALNRVYPHGLGLPGAIDREPPGSHQPPITDFGRSTSLFRPNARLDSDHDAIACEHP